MLSLRFLNSVRASDYTPQADDLVITDASGHETTVATWSATGPRATGLSASSG